jgi:hypothetical protein
MKTKPSMHVNLHCEEGRGMFQLDLSSFTSEERQFMLRVFEEGEKGSAVAFDVQMANDGRYRMTFLVGAAAPVAEADRVAA